LVLSFYDSYTGALKAIIRFLKFLSCLDFFIFLFFYIKNSYVTFHHFETPFHVKGYKKEVKIAISYIDIQRQRDLLRTILLKLANAYARHLLCYSNVSLNRFKKNCTEFNKELSTPKNDYVCSAHSATMVKIKMREFPNHQRPPFSPMFPAGRKSGCITQKGEIK
jgi:hypothetical protein